MQNANAYAIYKYTKPQQLVAAFGERKLRLKVVIFAMENAEKKQQQQTHLKLFKIIWETQAKQNKPTNRICIQLNEKPSAIVQQIIKVSILIWIYNISKVIRKFKTHPKKKIGKWIVAFDCSWNSMLRLECALWHRRTFQNLHANNYQLFTSWTCDKTDDQSIRAKFYGWIQKNRVVLFLNKAKKKIT